MNSTFTHADVLAVLKNARLFTQFSDVQLNQLISFSAVEFYPAGDTILHQGETNEKVFIILSGEVSVFADGEFILKLRRQGDLVGEISVITRQPTSATVVADTEVQLFSVSSVNVNTSGDAELRSILYKIFLDILTEKLTLTTKQVKGYQATTAELDIKKRELAESESDRYHKEAILQSVLGSMSDGVVVTEADGKLLHVNEAFRRLVGNVGIPPQFEEWPRALGLYWRDETTPYTVDDLPMIKIMQGRQVDDEEIFIRNSSAPDGVWLQASSRMLFAAGSDTVRGAVVVFRDFTKKKLEEKALIQAKENAEAMAKAKSDFLAVMSHELRTPLNSIMGMADLITDSCLPEEQKEYLETIKESSENLLTLIRNILDYSNLDSGKLKPEFKSFSLINTIRETVDSFRIHARKKGIELVLEPAPRIPERILGHKRGIEQTLRNLLDNAIKFSKQGTVRVSVEYRSSESGGPLIVCTVADHGIGIAADEIDRLFQPFAQADSSYTRSFEGAGIGLSVCRKYVDLLGGRIWAESQPGVGSTFRFSIPISLDPSDIAPEKTDGGEPDALSTAEDPIHGTPPLKILVAEDNALNQKLITKVLGKLGHQPELVQNGLEAVEMSRRHPFDLILMDLHMPEMDGIQAAEIISRERGKSEKPVIIALTANVSETVEKSCYQAGMSDYLTKPLKIQKLAEMLRKWS